MTLTTVLSRATCCAACILGCCAIASHNIRMYSERPDEPCVYTTPCNPRQPLSDMPERPEHKPMIGSKVLVVVSAMPTSPGRPFLLGKIT